MTCKITEDNWNPEIHGYCCATHSSRFSMTFQNNKPECFGKYKMNRPGCLSCGHGEKCYDEREIIQNCHEEEFFND